MAPSKKPLLYFNEFIGQSCETRERARFSLAAQACAELWTTLSEQEISTGRAASRWRAGRLGGWLTLSAG
jgi:hypothetical protein